MKICWNYVWYFPQLSCYFKTDLIPTKIGCNLRNTEHSFSRMILTIIRCYFVHKFCGGRKIIWSAIICFFDYFCILHHTKFHKTTQKKNQLILIVNTVFMVRNDLLSQDANISYGNRIGDSHQHQFIYPTAAIFQIRKISQKKETSNPKIPNPH